MTELNEKYKKKNLQGTYYIHDRKKKNENKDITLRDKQFFPINFPTRFDFCAISQPFLNSLFQKWHQNPLSVTWSILSDRKWSLV